MKTVTKEEYEAFLAAYPRPLVRDTVMFCEPPVVSHNDFTLGHWPGSVVAATHEVWDSNYQPTGRHVYRIGETA